MIKRIIRFFGNSSISSTQIAEGINLDMFKSFYHVLFCEADLESTMYFRDLEHEGVTKEEFMAISQMISDLEVDEHVVDVIFLLLDDEVHTRSRNS